MIANGKRYRIPTFFVHVIPLIYPNFLVSVLQKTEDISNYSPM